MNIGKLMQAAITLSQASESPVQKLRAITSDMLANLKWYETKHPEADTSKRRDLIAKLDVICRKLEECEPIDLMRIIRQKLMEAKKDQFRPDTAVIIIPLTPDFPGIYDCNPAFIDLTGWEMSSERDYDLIGSGINSKKYICSDTDEEGKQYGK